ncbi:MAG: aminomethyl-transferring glycine dehydrogenase subunit GcvPA [Peptostreptococcaceae bacterium]|nr:aminomethyl-transferring glycine dehydrogenase subunit GcvPA [Peptostreptococcaceae bacterium]
MHKYISHTPEEVKEMLQSIGKNSVDELFEDIPSDIRFKGDLDLQPAKSELEVRRILHSLSAKNKNVDELVCFLGAGSYDHYIPSIVKNIASRSEFYTSYTPYQPEVSQGTLQMIFEFQSMIAELTGLEVSNASLYDGSTAAAEACLMASDPDKKNVVVISKSVNPMTRTVLRTYLKMQDLEMVEVDTKDGRTDGDALKAALHNKVAAVLIQSPNFFGVIEDVETLEPMIHENKSALILSVDPLSLGLLKTPGELKADIAVGEGQALGNSLNYGGPYLGFIAATNKFLRKMPGRIVGESVDKNDNKAYVLTLQAREQHIRRSKATSNICSNQGLIALMATIYMSVMGKQGITEVSEQIISKLAYLKKRLEEKSLGKIRFNVPCYKEIAVDFGKDISELNAKLLEKGFLGGYDLGRDYPELKGNMLICVTEKRSKEEIDGFINALEEVLR